MDVWLEYPGERYWDLHRHSQTVEKKTRDFDTNLKNQTIKHKKSNKQKRRQQENNDKEKKLEGNHENITAECEIVWNPSSYDW